MHKSWITIKERQTGNKDAVLQQPYINLTQWKMQNVDEHQTVAPSWSQYSETRGWYYMQHALRSESWRVRAEVRDRTEKKAEREDMTEEVMWFTGEHKEVLAGNVELTEEVGVYLKPDRSGNVTVRWGERKRASCDQVARDCKICPGLQFIYWTSYCPQTLRSFIFPLCVFIMVSLPFLAWIFFSRFSFLF